VREVDGIVVLERNPNLLALAGLLSALFSPVSECAAYPQGTLQEQSCTHC
jgi:hypothetical protein